MVPYNYIADINSKGDETFCYGYPTAGVDHDCLNKIPIVYGDQLYALIQDESGRTIFFHPVFNFKDDELFQLLISRRSDETLLIK